MPIPNWVKVFEPTLAKPLRYHLVVQAHIGDFIVGESINCCLPDGTLSETDEAKAHAVAALKHKLGKIRQFCEDNNIAGVSYVKA